MGIAAIIPNYRQPELTARCAISLADQIDFVYVVDNSADELENTRLEEALDQVRFEMGSTLIEVINPSTNLGFGQGIALAIAQLLKLGQCHAIVLINNDAIAHKGMVERMFCMLDTHDGTAMVVPQTTGLTPSILWYHRLFALVLKRPLLGAFPYLSGACLLVPMSLARDGLFDPDFFMYGEDVEFSWRMAQQGVPLVTADAECEHAGSASSRLGSLFYEYHVARGHILLARKLARNNFEWAMLLLGRALSLPLRATLRCLRYKSLIPWSALVLACLGKAPPPPGT